jgi:hypothetical protein
LPYRPFAVLGQGCLMCGGIAAQKQYTGRSHDSFMPGG